MMNEESMKDFYEGETAQAIRQIEAELARMGEVPRDAELDDSAQTHLTALEAQLAAAKAAAGGAQ